MWMFDVLDLICLHTILLVYRLGFYFSMWD